MAKPRVLITSLLVRPGDEADRRMQEAGLEPVYNPWHGGRTEEEMMQILQGISGAVVSVDPFTPRVMDVAEQLKVVSRTGVGYDAIDVPAATARGIAVCTTPGTNNRAVAEFAFALMLQCSRKMVENLREVPQGRWVRHEGHDLAGSTLGIVGLGSIGKEIAKRALAFEMKVLAYDIFQDEAFAQQHQVSYIPLEQLLSESDYVTLHLFLDEKTHHLINAERLALMKPTAYLINTSRGGVVDTEALYEALKEKRIAGAALDVFEKEPPGDIPLLKLDNVYTASHVAGNTAEVRKASGLMAVENVIRILRGERPLYAVNPEVLR